MRFERHFGGIGIADIGVERGDDADRVFHRGAQQVAVRGDAAHAIHLQRLTGGFQMREAAEERVEDHRLKGIQLQLAPFGGKTDRHVIADHLKGHLVHHFRDHRVHLARHDRGTGLFRGQVDLIEARARTRGQEPQIVAGFRQFHRHPLQHARDLHEGAAILRGFDQIRRGDHRDAGDIGQMRAHAGSIFGMRGDAGADGGGAHVDLKDQLRRLHQAGFIL